MDIKKAEPIQAKYGEASFQVNQPTVMVLRDFKKRVAAASSGKSEEDELDVMIEFCKKTGVPDDIFAQWSMDELKQFFDAIGQSEKKT